jgi:hypothetical protein
MILIEARHLNLNQTLNRTKSINSQQEKAPKGMK